MEPVFQNPILIEGTVYMASDFHLGSPNEAISKERETKIITWLESVKEDASYLFLLGDIFDYWFEYKDVVPRGYFNFLAKLGELHSRGVQIFYFTGNHDMWVKDYFTKELGMKIFREQQSFVINGKRCQVGHGDGLGPKDKGYKLIKFLFALRVNRFLYGCLHPRISFAIARFFSGYSRSMTSLEERKFLGDEKEFLIQYANSVLEHENIDYFVYGHRHLPLEIALHKGATYFNTGDWLVHNSFLKIEQDSFRLLKYS